MSDLMTQEQFVIEVLAMAGDPAWTVEQQLAELARMRAVRMRAGRSRISRGTKARLIARIVAAVVVAVGLLALLLIVDSPACEQGIFAHYPQWAQVAIGAVMGLVAVVVVDGRLRKRRLGGQS